MTRPPPSPQFDNAVHGARLVIDLDAIAANYHQIAAAVAPAATAAVVKADAYGLGLDPVARRLASEGCRIFFVAHFAEGVALRAIVPDAHIYVLHGLHEDAVERCHAHRLRPVLNNLHEIALWRNASGPREGAILNFDTGMSRLGLSAQDIARLSSGLIQGVEIDYVMSHLACADDPAHLLNARQLSAFNQMRALFPGIRASLANTAGTMLGSPYHFDLVRPGIGLYGGAPEGVGKTPFQPVISLFTRIVQLRDVDSTNYVGYGATYRPGGPARIAVAGIGYADGYMRALGNIGFGFLAGRRVPLVGRISMDLCAFDVSGVSCAPGDEIELIGPNVSLEQAASDAGTINYEILTGLGSRFNRQYVNQGAASK